jgi:hypothetical protein
MPPRRIKIGYVPYSQDLQHPGDRRRLKIVSELEGVDIEINDLENLDVLVLSNSSNFSKYLKKVDCPVILDLVDAYLAERPSFFRDFGRNILRTLNGTSSLRFLRYTSHLKYACKNADAVIVATIEQSQLIEDLNINVHIIIDDQSEMFSERVVMRKNSLPDEKFYLFWEGLGYTLKHFKTVSNEIEEFLISNNFYLKLLTNQKFHRWGGFLGTSHTEDIVRKLFPRAWEKIEILPWSVEGTKNAARSSMLGIIPLTKSDKFAMFKPENKLISMWAMGIPVLCSPSAAYSRVAQEINTPTMLCEGNWLESLRLTTSNADLRNNMIERGIDYYNRYCTLDILRNKWLEAIDSVLTE